MFTEMNVTPKYIDLNSLKELPESHAWDPSDNCPSVDIESPFTVIDVNNENAFELIGNACKSWGVFQVVNHNISKSLLDEVEGAAKCLFSLPMQQKLKVEQSRTGAPGYGVPPVSSLFPKLSWIEGFTISGSPLEHARKLWPTDYKTFCDVIEKYQKEMKTLAIRLTWLMLGSLGITKDDVEWGAPKGDFEAESAALQLNAYPVCPDPDRAMGLAGHTDSSLLTILHQNTSGLQCHQEGIGWVAIPLIPGALTVIVGDLFHILSNGLFRSAFHRATVNGTTYRVSAAYFFGPPPNIKVSPIPKLVDQSHTLLYSPVTWSEYRDIKLKYHNNTLSTIRICTLGEKDVDAYDNLNSVQAE